MQKKKHRKNFEAYLEEVQKQAGAIIENWNKTAQLTQDHFEYESISAYDARSYKNEEHDRAVQQEHQDKLEE